MKWVVENWDEIKIVLGGIWAGIEAVIGAVWNTLKFSFSGLALLFTTVKDWLVENWDTIAEVISLIWEGLKFTVTEVYNAITGGIESIKKFFTDAKIWFTETWNTVTETVDTVWEAVKTAVTNVFDFYKGIFTGIKTIFEGVLAFFSAGAGTDDETTEKIQAVKDLFTAMKDKLLGIFETISNVFNSFLNMLGLPDLGEMLPDVGAILSSAKNFLSDIISKAIKFIKSKLSFFGGGDDEDTKAEEFVEGATDSGLLTRTDKWYEKGKKVEVDQSKLEEMSPNSIMELGESLSSQGLMTPEIEEQLSSTIRKKQQDRTGFEEFSDSNLNSYIRGIEGREAAGKPSPGDEFAKKGAYEELSRRPNMPSKEGKGTLGTALNSVPDVPLVLQSAGKPAPSTGNIVGLGQESVGQSGTMNNAQASLNETKTVNYVSQSAGNNTVVNSDNSTSVVNTSVYNPAVSPAMDTSDRTTGSYRDYMSYR